MFPELDDDLGFSKMNEKDFVAFKNNPRKKSRNQSSYMNRITRGSGNGSGTSPFAGMIQSDRIFKTSM